MLSTLSPKKGEMVVKVTANEKSRPSGIIKATKIFYHYQNSVKYLIWAQHCVLCQNILRSTWGSLSIDIFMTDRNSFQREKSWLPDVRLVKVYLHNNKFTRLDIKEYKVLTSAEHRALLCDFKGLNMTGIFPLKISNTIPGCMV